MWLCVILQTLNTMSWPSRMKGRIDAWRSSLASQRRGTCTVWSFYACPASDANCVYINLLHENVLGMSLARGQSNVYSNVSASPTASATYRPVQVLISAPHVLSWSRIDAERSHTWRAQMTRPTPYFCKLYGGKLSQHTNRWWHLRVLQPTVCACLTHLCSSYKVNTRHIFSNVDMILDLEIETWRSTPSVYSTQQISMPRNKIWRYLIILAHLMCMIVLDSAR